MSRARAVGFLVHPSRTEASAVAERLVAHLRSRGATVTTYEGAETDDDARAAAFASGLDLVVSVGGDGTFLRAAHLASRAGAPVLGVKVGRLGFLTGVEPADADAVLDGFLAGTVRIDDRLAVQATASAAPWSGSRWALNEVIVEKRTRHRLVRLAVSVDDAYVTTISADGVIVATPTGSTAYSFSAGGPIVSPEVPCLVVTPVAAHMVFDRSFVVPADATVRLTVVGEEPGLLSADGRASLELPVGASVAIARAPEPARFVQRPDAPGFHARLREKFGLPGDPVAPSD
ncbi:MAG: NAD(+)/NADH kinase [Actinomycetota bacterium]